MALRPIPRKFEASRNKTLAQLPDIILGAGVFNYQYHEKPDQLPAKEILERAFDQGILALDTSAYYGPSEIIVGEALQAIKDKYPRESYYICTKAGRVAEDVFDYSPESIRKSVLRSLDRLHTDYLDVVYIHDVEFVDTKDCLIAVSELFKLKQQGLIHYAGISGYPLDFLLYLTTKIKSELPGGPLDIVLSYSNLCIQNTRLAQYVDKFKQQAGVNTVLNASPLSMSLLRSEKPHDFHPAPANLKAAVAKAAQYTSSKGVELADLGSRYALYNWSGSTVFGLSSPQEVDKAIGYYWDAQDEAIAAADKPLVEQVRSILGDTIDLVWPSGISHPDMS